MANDDGIQLSVAKTVRIPRDDDPDKTAFEIECEEGLCSLRRVSTANRVKCTLDDLQRAVSLLTR